MGVSTEEDLTIPKHARAGVAFLGVEFHDALILILSVFLGLFAGFVMKMDVAGYLGVPILGYILNRAYINWRSNQLPGQLQGWLYAHGLLGYSRALNKRAQKYVGDARVGNLGSLDMVDALINEYIERKDENGSAS